MEIEKKSFISTKRQLKDELSFYEALKMLNRFDEYLPFDDHLSFLDAVKMQSSNSFGYSTCSSNLVINCSL